MKLTETKRLNPAVLCMTLTAEAAEFETAIEEIYQAEGANYTLEGKEKGQATRAEIEAKEGEQFFYYAAVNALLEKDADALFSQAVQQENAMPLSMPELNVTHCDKDGFCLEVTLVILPPVTLGAYKGLTFSYPAIPTPAGAVDAQLEMLRARAAAQQGAGMAG